MNSWLGSWGATAARADGPTRGTSTDTTSARHVCHGPGGEEGPAAELMTPVIYVPRPGASAQGQRNSRRRRRPSPASGAPGAERAQHRPAAEVAADAATTGTPAPRPERAAEAPPRAERPPRPDRPDRGPAAPAAQVVRVAPAIASRATRALAFPGSGTERRPEKPKSLTHDPFAALAAKVEAARTRARG